MKITKYFEPISVYETPSCLSKFKSYIYAKCHHNINAKLGLLVCMFTLWVLQLHVKRHMFTRGMVNKPLPRWRHFPVSRGLPWCSIEFHRNYRKIANIRRTRSQNLNVYRLAFQLSLCNILKPSVEWRCSWSSADWRCSNYIWVINNLISY